MKVEDSTITHSGEWKDFIISKVNRVEKLLEENTKSQIETNIILKEFIAKQGVQNKRYEEKYLSIENRVNRLETLQRDCPARLRSESGSRAITIVSSIFGVIGVAVAILAFLK